MNERELFLDGHKELLTAVKLINKPLYYVPRHRELEVFNTPLESGTIIFGDAEVGEGIEVVAPISKDVYRIIIETFCKSHLRLK